MHYAHECKASPLGVLGAEPTGLAVDGELDALLSDRPVEVVHEPLHDRDDDLGLDLRAAGSDGDAEVAPVDLFDRLHTVDDVLVVLERAGLPVGEHVLGRDDPGGLLGVVGLVVTRRDLDEADGFSAVHGYSLGVGAYDRMIMETIVRLKKYMSTLLTNIVKNALITRLCVNH